MPKSLFSLVSYYKTTNKTVKCCILKRINKSLKHKFKGVDLWPFGPFPIKIDVLNYKFVGSNLCNNMYTCHQFYFNLMDAFEGVKTKLMMFNPSTALLFINSSIFSHDIKPELSFTIVNTEGAGVILWDWIMVNSSGIWPLQAPE